MTNQEIKNSPWDALVYFADKLTDEQFDFCVRREAWTALEFCADRLTKEQLEFCEERRND
jgi:hypothetical protein